MMSGTLERTGQFVSEPFTYCFHNSRRTAMTANTKRTLLAFDYGTRKIGVAVGQEVTGTASPVSVLQCHSGKPDWQAITQLVDNWRPQALVVGLPLNMDDSEQSMTIAARRFGRQLEERYNLPVYAVDERLSTKEAEGRLRASGKPSASRQDEDAVAAQIILETWFSQQHDTDQQRE